MTTSPTPSDRDWAVLRHERPGGDHHFDLLIRRAPGDTAAHIPTWRCPRDPVPGVFQTVERLADHRAAYLTYEGPISGGRGAVSRVRGGRLRPSCRAGETLLVLPDGASWRLSFGANSTLTVAVLAE